MPIYGGNPADAAVAGIPAPGVVFTSNPATVTPPRMPSPLFIVVDGRTYRKVLLDPGSQVDCYNCTSLARRVARRIPPGLMVPVSFYECPTCHYRFMVRAQLSISHWPASIRRQYRMTYGPAYRIGIDYGMGYSTGSAATNPGGSITIDNGTTYRWTYEANSGLTQNVGTPAQFNPRQSGEARDSDEAIRLNANRVAQMQRSVEAVDPDGALRARGDDRYYHPDGTPTVLGMSFLSRRIVPGDPRYTNPDGTPAEDTIPERPVVDMDEVPTGGRELPRDISVRGGEIDGRLSGPTVQDVGRRLAPQLMSEVDHRIDAAIARAMAIPRHALGPDPIVQDAIRLADRLSEANDLGHTFDPSPDH